MVKEILKSEKTKLADLPLGKPLENPEAKIVGFVKEYIKTDEPVRNKKWIAPPFPKEVERILECFHCQNKWKENFLETQKSVFKRCAKCDNLSLISLR